MSGSSVAGASRRPAPAVGRLLRATGDDGWAPVGEPLPPFDHAPPAPSLALAPWVLPATLEPRAFDVVVVGELAHQLLGRCDPDDEAVIRLFEQTALLHGPEAAAAWLAEVEVWLGRRLDRTPWPRPPRRPSLR
ncbi:MAG: hypothetical protein AAGD35_20040 [Actinomycetota bacterium]